MIEFAFVLPIILLMFLGGYQFSDAIACNRKVTITARSIADLTSRYSDRSASDLDTLLGASAQIMTPYPSSKAMVRVTEISTDAANQSTVTWSRALNGTRRSKGDTFPLPANLKLAKSSIIYAEVVYAYSPVANITSLGQINLTQQIYMVPRVSSTVDCDDCPK